MMEKWGLHIITVIAFVIFIVLGLASATGPEVDGTPRDNTPKKGGIIEARVVNTSYWGYSVFVGNQGIQLKTGSSRTFRVFKDGEYEISYIGIVKREGAIEGATIGHPVHENSPSKKKIVNVSGGQRIVVNIP